MRLPHLLTLILIGLTGLFSCVSQPKTAPTIQPQPLAKNTEQAKHALEKSKQLGYLGEQAEQAQRYDEAVAKTRQAIFKAQEANALAWLIRWQWQLGRVFNAQGQTTQAIQAYQQAVQRLVPDNTFRWKMTECQAPGEDTSLYQQLRPLFFELADLLLQRAATDNNPATQQRDLQQARTTIEQLKTADLENYFGDCVAASQSVDEIKDTHAAVIYPILLEQRLELLVSLPRQETPPPIQLFTVPNVGRQQISQTVAQFREQLEAGHDNPESQNYLPHAQQLYRWLIAPLQATLTQNQIHTLVFVPEGPLGTIPMAALHDGNAFLMQTYALAITPGLTLTAPNSGTLTRDKTVALIGALTEDAQGYPKLPYASKEVEAITQFYNNTEKLLNKQFTAAQFEQRLKPSNNQASNYTLIHIISHAEFAQNARDSFIVTYDGKLRFDDLESIIGLAKHRQTPIELLTLSACNTAKGDEEWAALGLSGVALKAGAHSSLATLWKADDKITYHLVKNFYESKQNNLSKAQALQEAQQTVIGTIYEHPFYWAPLILIGNWL
jgi:CHAT domain-containing protein